MVTRRSSGDGSIYQRNDGRWMGAVSLGLDHNGRRLRRTVSAKTKSEVSRRLRKLQSRLEANTVAVDEDITVAKWCRVWLDTTVINTTKASTQSQYRYVLERWVLPHVGQHRLTALAPEHVGLMVARLSESGLSVSTVRQARRVLSSALAHAQRSRRIPYNLVSVIPAPRYDSGPRPQTRPTPTTLSEDEAKHLLVVCETHPDVPVAGFATIGLMMGLRRGEILGLYVTDIDGDWLSVERSLGEKRTPTVDGGWITELAVWSPKTSGSRRILPLSPQVADAIQRLLTFRNRLESASEDPWVGEPFLFCQPGGGGIWPSNLRRRFKRLLVDADLPDIKIHELRHTFAVLCLAGRVPLEAVSEALGHSRIETTKNIYAPHVPQLGHRAVNDLGRILETDPERRRLKAVPLPEEGVA